MTQVAKTAAAIAVAIMLGFLWLSLIHDPGVRRDLTVKLGVDSLRARAESIAAAAAVRDSARADTARQLERQLVVSRNTSNALAGPYRARLADSLRAGFDSVVAAKDATIARQDALLALRDRQLADQARDLGALRASLEDALGRLDLALTHTGPRIHCGPGVGAGVSLGGGASLYVGGACVI